MSNLPPQRSKSDRFDDERLLQMIRWRVEGHSTMRIAAHYGLRGPYVRTATNRVMDEDIALSGEPEADVRAAYWRAA